MRRTGFRAARLLCGRAGFWRVRQTTCAISSRCHRFLRHPSRHPNHRFANSIDANGIDLDSSAVAAAATASSKLLECVRMISIWRNSVIYIVMGAIALLAIAYIVYRILDLLARRKFAQSYAAWEPDLGQYYRKQPSHRIRQGAIPIGKSRIKRKDLRDSRRFVPDAGDALEKADSARLPTDSPIPSQAPGPRTSPPPRFWLQEDHPAPTHRIVQPRGQNRGRSSRILRQRRLERR